MKTLLMTLIMVVATTSVAQPVFLNIPADNESTPGVTIPTASHEECGKLMIKLSKEEKQNFYLSCSIVPQTR